MMKSKYKHNIAPGDLNFTIPYQLEDALARMKSLRSNSNQVLLTQMSDDLVAFELHSINKGDVNATITGTLRRWQGTETLVDCKRLFIAPRIQQLATANDQKTTGMPVEGLVAIVLLILFLPAIYSRFVALSG